MKRLRTLIFAVLTSALLAPAGAADKLSFALMGDVPYSAVEAFELEDMIEAMNREQLAFVIHVGDITGGDGPCGDAWLGARRQQFQKFKHAFIIVPGDNEWVDCHRSGMQPLERLGKFRALFEAGDMSLGQSPIRLERQSGRFAEYREHMRWIAGNVLFVGLNVQGSNNNLGRTPEMDAEYRARMAAVLAWLDDSKRLAQQRKLAGMVIFAQADPDFEGRFRRKPGEANGFAEFIGALRALALDYRRPILFVHGDTHNYRVDRPLTDPATGKRIENFTRVIVFGSPQLRWIRATIDPDRPALFSVEPADLPR